MASQWPYPAATCRQRLRSDHQRDALPRSTDEFGLLSGHSSRPCRKEWSRPLSITAYKLYPACDGAVVKFGKPSRSSRFRMRSLTRFVRTCPGRSGRWSSSNASRECGLGRFGRCERSTLIRPAGFGFTLPRTSKPGAGRRRPLPLQVPVRCRSFLGYSDEPLRLVVVRAAC